MSVLAGGRRSYHNCLRCPGCRAHPRDLPLGRRTTHDDGAHSPNDAPPQVRRDTSSALGSTGCWRPRRPNRGFHCVDDRTGIGLFCGPSVEQEVVWDHRSQGRGWTGPQSSVTSGSTDERTGRRRGPRATRPSGHRALLRYAVNTQCGVCRVSSHLGRMARPYRRSPRSP
jgi:hypothetical protein